MTRKRRSWALYDDEIRTLGFGGALVLVLYWGFRTPSPETIIAGLVATLLTGLRLLKGKDTEDESESGTEDGQASSGASGGVGVGPHGDGHNEGLDRGGDGSNRRGRGGYRRRQLAWAR